MRYFHRERLDRLRLGRLVRVRARALRLRNHPRQLPPAKFEAALKELDTYIARRTSP